jgi:bacteriochlorophyllide a dehydrogenase
MSRKALAIVNVAPNQVELQEVPLVDPGPDDVVVLTRHSMISNGTERSVLAGERTYGLPIYPFPQVGGYQKVGVVESVGKNVTGIKEGDWVFAVFGKIGFKDIPCAGHVGVAVAEKDWVVKLPEGLDPLVASGLVLTQVGYNHGSRPPVQAGTRAVVVGAGLVGLWCAETLQERGASVMLLGRGAYRLNFFHPQGDSCTVDVSATDADKAVKEFCPNGAPIVVDTLTKTEDLQKSLRFLAHDGHIVAGGYYVEPFHLLNIQNFHDKEATLYTPGGMTRERLIKTLDWIVAGKLQVQDKITHHWPIAKATEAYDLLVHGGEPFLAMVIDW